MTFSRTRISVGTLLLISSLVPAVVQAQDAPQRVEVTGSLIKRVEAEGPAPVTVLGRKQIERIGATSLTELVRSIAAMDILDQGEFTANSPTASGTTNVQVRGMAATNLLVLLNGRRLPGNPLTSSDASDAAVDINLIPMGAIERIEVLKDGGSAIYGADAVVGVINFITRKNFTGVEVGATLGQSSRSDGRERKFNLALGIGDYDRDGANLLATAEIFERDPIARADRTITSSSNWSGYGGPDSRSSYHPSGNILNSGGAIIGSLVPCPAGQQKGAGCRYDTNASLLNLQNGADRFSSLLVGNLKLTSSARVYGELAYAESNDTLELHPANDTVSYLGQTVRIRPMQPGPRVTEHSGSMLRWVLGAEGTTSDVDWNLDIGQGKSTVVNADRNYLDLTKLHAHLADGSFNPTSTSNPQSVMDDLLISPRRSGRTSLQFVDAKASGSGIKLPGGELGYAVGGQLLTEKLLDQPDANQIAGNVFGGIQMASADARRQLAAVFTELSLPLAPQVEAQVAVRHDRYYGTEGWMNDTWTRGAGAGHTSRKLALKVRPAQALALRASWAESFRMPTLKQLFGGQDAGADNTNDTSVLCPAFGIAAADCTAVPYRIVAGANPNLKPESGTTTNFGFVLEPTRDVSLTVDFWQVKKKDEINQPTETTAVQKGLYANVDGNWTVYTNSANLTASRTRGMDADLQARFALAGVGRLLVGDSVTYYQSMRRQDDALDPLKEYVGTFAKPRWRNTLTVALETATWTPSVAVRSSSAMRDTDQSHETTSYATARTITPHSEVDLGVEYHGIKSLSVSGVVKNAFDVAPPFSTTGTTSGYGSLGYPWMYSARGRYFQAAARYVF